MSGYAKIIEDSISEEHIRLITLECRLPRIILAELNTHRQFSHNSSSSRAIPIQKLVRDVLSDMFVPTFWGKNQKGMQSTEELTGWRRSLAEFVWRSAGYIACYLALFLFHIGLHKQYANRIYEPFSYVTVLITSDQWKNFFALRNHKDAQPEIQLLARQILEAISKSTPKLVKFGEWHLPYVTDEERKSGLSLDDLKKISIARCASTSYKTVDGKIMTLEKAVTLGDKLMGTVPLHASPAEHQATPDVHTKQGWKNQGFHGNFFGWCQNRKFFPNEFFPDYDFEKDV